MTVIIMRKLREHWLFLLLMLTAFVIRVYRFGSVPGGFNQDEAMATYDAFSLALYGTDRFGMRLPVYFTAWGYGQMSVLLSYTMVPFIWLFGLSAVTARLPMLLVSMAGIFALYVFIKDTCGKHPALVALAFAAVCPWHIMQTRWALDCNMFPHMLMIGICWLNKGVNRRRGYLWLSMAVFGISMYAYGVAFYTVPLLLAGLCVYLLTQRHVTIKQVCICAGVYIFFAWPALAVVLINFFKWPTLQTPLFTIPFFPDTVRMNDLLPFSPDIAMQLRENIISLYNVMIKQWDGLPWNAIRGYGLLYALSLPFTIVGLAVCLVKRNTGIAMLLCWLVVSVIAGLTINGVNINRVNIIMYPLMMLTGMGLYEAVLLPMNWLRNRRWAIKITRVAGVVLALAYGVACLSFGQVYFGSHNTYLSRLFYDGFFDCLRIAEREGYDRLCITAWTQYPGGAQVSEILTLYGLRVDPSFYQESDAYNNKYVYVSFNDTPIPEPNSKTIFIFNVAEAGFFPADLFDTILCQDFGVAVKR